MGRKPVPLRPPVVTIMGHVDHGKTTLLDYLRKSAVAASEAGGITQHIGAFSVELPGLKATDSIKRVTFLDTPGHAAFSRIRERGAQVTDIVVLVVAADDGVMAQTVESIKFAEAVRVPIVVAISKCDKYGPERVSQIKSDLLKQGVVCEDFGGDTQSVAVSGLTGLNMTSLLECILLQGELLELRADPNKSVHGTVIESRIKRGLGDCATMLVQEGTLQLGTLLVAEDAVCKVRVMSDHAGHAIHTATPSTPVEVAGWRSLPRVGATVIQVPSEEEAAHMAAHHVALKDEVERQARSLILKERHEIHNKMWQVKQTALARNSTTPLRQVLSYEEFQTDTTSALPTLNLLIKCDVIGSQEAVATIIREIPAAKAKVNIISNTVGPLSDTDIKTAKTTKARVIVFGLRTPKLMIRLAERESVQIAEFDIIYRLSEYVTQELTALLPIELDEKRIGSAAVLQLFTLGKAETVIGCRVDDGTIFRSREILAPNVPRYSIRVLRGGKPVWKGQIASMRHLKKEITMAGKGMECGIILDNPSSVPFVLPADVIECIEKSIIKPSLK